MNSVQKDLFIFEDAFEINNGNIPSELVIRDEVAYEALLIRLLCGTLKVKFPICGKYSEIIQLTNYSIPGSIVNRIFKKKIVKDFFSLDHYRQSEQRAINEYIRINRRNNFVHRQLLSELTNAIITIAFCGA